MSDLQAIWNTILEVLQKETNVITYDCWIKPLEPISILDGKLILLATNEGAKDVAEKYTKQISTAASQCHSSLSSVQIIEPSEKDTFDTSIAQKDSGDNEDPINSVALNKRYTFSTFVVGAGNQFADAAARAVAANPGGKHNPLFIYGGVGLGKTHIMHAIGNEIKANKPELKVVYVTSETFTNEIIDAIFEGKDRGLNKDFKKRYRSVDVLMIDDIQFIAGKPSVQEEFFHTFNDLYQNGKQIIISSDRSPKEIRKLEDRLRSRFEWGLLADIQPPDIVTRIAIIQRKAQQENYNLSKEVMEFIAERFDSNVRLLEGALTRVVFYSSLLHKPLTKELAKEALKDYLTETQETLSVETIIENVCRYYRVTHDDIVGKKRNKEIVWPRQMCMYLASELMNLPLSSVGELFGRDHSTVIHARDKIAELVKMDTQVYSEVVDIRNLIKKK